MRKLLLLAAASVFIIACNSKKSETVDANQSYVEQTTTDSIKSNKVSELQNLISKYGSLIEYKTYSVGKFKNIKFEVIQITNINSSEVNICANLEINYEDAYYYYQEYNFILQDEIPDFISGLEILKSKYANTSQDTETRIGYISSGDIRIRALYKDAKWKYDFHVNYRKANAGVSFTENDFDTIIALFKKTDEKINELKNK